MGQTIACANQKGGVGKTTTVVNLASYLALLGDRVLVIDLDPQGNGTSGLGVDRSSVERSMYDALVDGVPLEGLVIQGTAEGVDLVPAAIALAGADLELAGVTARERRLRRLVEPVAADYDVIFIDCPPSLGLLTVNALTAADAVLIPLQCEYYALEGLTQLLATIDLVRDHLNPHLSLQGVVLTMYDARLNLCRQVAEDAKEYFGAKMFVTPIPRNVRLAEAPSFGKPILLYDVQSVGAKSYLAVAEELMLRIESAPVSEAPEALPEVTT